MADQPFITLVAGGMQAKSQASIATHDTSRTKYHMSDISTFATRLENVGQLPVRFIIDLDTDILFKGSGQHIS
jgi:hypothetical protein